jgi:adenine-specific DNA-methyltransferase
MKIPPSSKKLRGCYYTPMPIANFIVAWAVNSRGIKVLEPSAGDGNFLESVVNRLDTLESNKKASSGSVVGIEIDLDESNRARNRIKKLGINESEAQIITTDFFKFCNEQLKTDNNFDVIVGNPPFIRYQNFPEEQRIIAFNIMRAAGLHPTKLTNAWVPFLVGSTLLLGNHGKIGMVIPAELLQVSYASELRQFLSERLSRLTLVTFKKLLFDGAQQEVILLLGEKNGNERRGIRTVEMDNMENLAFYKHPSFSEDELKPLDHTNEKWTQYFLNIEEISLIRKLRSDQHLKRLGELAEVDVGIVTGLNDFFVMNKQKITDTKLIKHTIPLVSRSAHLSGIIFSDTNLKSNIEENYPAFLLSVPSIPSKNLSLELQEYIENGERLGINKGYKCRIRNYWYSIPSIWVPDGFLLRQINNYPKLILNNSGATCTDTIHRVKFKNNIEQKLVAAAFLNSATFAFSEILGRSYGGGILELEPREAERLPIPTIGASRLDINHINKFLAEGSIYDVLEVNDEILLYEGLGLTRKEVKSVRGIWEKLRDRRNGRRSETNKNKMIAQAVL